MSVILSGCEIKEEAKKLYNYGVDEILCIEDEKLIEGHMQLHHDAVIEVLKEKVPKVILIGGQHQEESLQERQPMHLIQN